MLLFFVAFLSIGVTRALSGNRATGSGTPLADLDSEPRTRSTLPVENVDSLGVGCVPSVKISDGRSWAGEISARFLTLLMGKYCA